MRRVIPIKIFFGDLIHDWKKVGIWNIPLGVGYVASYAKKHGPESIECRIFKSPDLLIEAMKNDPPHIVALSHYIWNRNVNEVVYRAAKSISPQILTVGGGPNITDINSDQNGAKEYFSSHLSCDVYVVNAGEPGFVKLLETYVNSDGDIDKFKKETIGGCIVNNIGKDGSLYIGNRLDSLETLDDIPSPYLSGLLDEFFDIKYIPMIETNRACPYRCTFCAWGLGTKKLSIFSEDRVFSEIEYIARKSDGKGSTLMRIADANFSILERDAEIAKKVVECREQYGFPHHLTLNWNKSRPDRISRVARELKGLAEVRAGVQTVNEVSLKEVKRKNLSLEVMADLNDELKEFHPDNVLSVDLMLGLPLDTAEAHIDSNKKIIDLGASAYNYNTYLLPGTEMSSPESREQYIRKTGWRLSDNAFGVYDGERVLEGEEVVLETSTMRFEEITSFRFLHFLLQFMWSHKWYEPYLHLLWRVGVHPVDVVLAVAEEFSKTKGALRKIYDDFRDDHELEFFQSEEDLIKFWTEEDNFLRLESGEYGKLNYLYTYRIIMSHKKEFKSMLLDVGEQLLENNDSEAELMPILRDVLRYNEKKHIVIDDGFVIEREKDEEFSYKMFDWESNGYQGLPGRKDRGKSEKIKFFIDDEKFNHLQSLIDKYKSPSLNHTLRMMSLYTSVDQFMCSVERAE